MTEQTFLVLSVMAAGPAHGYKIMGAVAELTDGSVKLAAGTLYGILERLVSHGLLQAVREETHQGRRRVVYELTRGGASAVTAEAERRSLLSSRVTGLLVGLREART
ncbi:MAG TPA: PadR family transcriptional regulator [Acidimicrobiia bacterium]|nr:PadR family transcriptional regulator [Acidimicrobiia bacterium]